MDHCLVVVNGVGNKMVDSWYRYGDKWGSLSVEKNTSGKDIMYVVNNGITGKIRYPAGDNGRDKAEKTYNMLRYNDYIEYLIIKR